MATFTAGILFVHGREGGFVVGAGRNGMAYSVLLIVSFAAVAWSHWPVKVPAEA